jgi:hypothetical protein
MEQQSLFTLAEQQALYRTRYQQQAKLQMGLSAEALCQWQQRILDYQSQVSQTPVVMQSSLLAELGSQPLATSIDPFSLQRRSLNFWRWPADSPGVAALYFVIDYRWPLLLYIGETCKANQRWKGEHDCKRYAANYQALHSQHGLTAPVGIAFWMDAPSEVRDRQHWESMLIERWRSPFNKQNWQFWGTPFIGDSD